MPVYLLTAHAYRSWGEDHPRGYIQHGHGLQPTNPRLAEARRQRAKHPPMRFDGPMQSTLHRVVCEVTEEGAYADITLHAVSATPTHLHLLIAFATPLCVCGVASKFCGRTCPARRFAQTWLGRVKSIAGYRLAKQSDTPGRKWFSRGWDITPVRDAAHHGHLMNTYLPRHVHEGGTVKIYR